MNILTPTFPSPLAISASPIGDAASPPRQPLPVRFDHEMSAVTPTSAEDTLRILQAADAILEQGEDLLRDVAAEDYTRRLPLAFNASLGGHYRHCLDHFTSFFRSLDRSMVDYDDRDRDLRIESDPLFALEETRSARLRLARVGPADLNAEVLAKCEVSYAAGAAPTVSSSRARELIYVIAHAIHHYALLSVMAGMMGVKLPARFGVAPSTVAHQTKVSARVSPPPNHP